ncbi:MAG: hypothetical protein Q3980_00915 [Turicibacter sp.]|nr:hypothetical protein [Turicibacter sp.]
MPKNIFQDEIDVLKYQRNKLKNLDDSYKTLNTDLDELEKQLKSFMSINQVNFDKLEPKSVDNILTPVDKESIQIERTFNDLVKESHESGYKNIDIYDVATQEEVEEANRLLRSYYQEFSNQYRLDKYDYVISGILGSLAALMDYFLVTTVSGKEVTSGKLKSCTENFWNKILSQDKIKFLEEKYRVTYDISLNTSKISQEVLGLCPRYHRFQSLGHDPIIGFVFGVRDLMKGQLTAIDANGRLIIQSVKEAETKGFIESIITVFGHFLSDVGTKSKTGKILSVPAPFTPLLQLIQYGSIEYRGQSYTVADLSKKMYSDGYNFNHFIGMSLPVMLIEILTRLSFVLKENFFLKQDVQIKGNPKLNIMLCIANGILFAENVGKLAITKNPFSINYVSWISMAKYGFKTLKWTSYDKEMGEISYAQQYIDLRWKYLEQSSKLFDEDLVYYID